MEETVELAYRAMMRRERLRHVAMNVAKLVRLRNDADLARDVASSNIVGIDGMGIVYGLRLQGIEATRVPGCDLMFRLLELCAHHGFRPFILGARQDVLEQAVSEAKKRWPGIKFAGSRNGYFGFEEEQGVVDEIRESGADCLFVAMPTPRKERFLARHFDALSIPFVMGVGGSVDVLSGHVSRAPEGWQKAGLEWLYRLLQEPRKMAWRYASTNTAFMFLLLKDMVRRRLHERAAQRRG
jgi:N-acetylglucosaminyldiphosphoundecaprenol N-acetyl-beta-D-mannosaminyltransferase